MIITIYIYLVHNCTVHVLFNFICVSEITYCCICVNCMSLNKLSTCCTLCPIIIKLLIKLSSHNIILPACFSINFTCSAIIVLQLLCCIYIIQNENLYMIGLRQMTFMLLI